MKQVSVNFWEFFNIPNKFFQIVGIVAYEKNKKDLKTSAKDRVLQIIFWASLTNLFLCFIEECIFFILGFGDFNYFLELTALAPCMALTSMSLEETVMLWRKREKFTRIINYLENVFPADPKEQVKYQIPKTYQNLRTVMIYFSTLYITLICSFNFVPVIVTIIKYYQGLGFKRELPYYMWYPFDTTTDIAFPIVYFHQSWGGFATVIAVLAVNLFLGVMITQFCIQFDILYIKIKELKPKAINYKKDLKKLIEIVKAHTSLITHWKELEGYCSFSIFVNHIMSSLIICLVGFQVVVVDDTSIIFKYVLFLICSLLQTTAMSYFGNQIIEQSVNISKVIYESDWIDSEIRFKKCLLMIMMRTRRPLGLTALNFTTVSFGSLTKILSTSYSYFALLRTMYTKNH